MDSDDLLTSFRQEWCKELTNSSCRGNSTLQGGSGQPFVDTEAQNQNSLGDERRRTQKDNNGNIHTDQEIQAAELFKQGVWHERSGKLYEAIKYYRRAIAMVPDIEIRVHRQYIQDKSSALGSAASVDYYDSDSPDDVEEEEGEEEEDPIDGDDLVSKFEVMFGNNRPICQPSYSQEAAHISCLPVEMLERILLWLVGDNLDINSLERMASVCRGFYVICRKSDIWKRACLRVWGINLGYIEGYGSWREMFLLRPHPRFNGCYISKTTYFRSGENSFQDQSYQPWHFVRYYRYIRFYPNSKALMMTTADEPQSVVGLLKKDSKASQICQGHYRIHGSAITLVFRTCNRKNIKAKGRRQPQGTTDVTESTFQIEFEIVNVRGRHHWQLAWKGYSTVSCNHSGSRTISVVDVTDPCRFPPMNFSRVKSYALESAAPLA